MNFCLLLRYWYFFFKWNHEEQNLSSTSIKLWGGTSLLHTLCRDWRAREGCNQNIRKSKYLFTNTLTKSLPNVRTYINNPKINFSKSYQNYRNRPWSSVPWYKVLSYTIFSYYHSIANSKGFELHSSLT